MWTCAFQLAEHYIFLILILLIHPLVKIWLQTSQNQETENPIFLGDKLLPPIKDMAFSIVGNAHLKFLFLNDEAYLLSFH
jgi:hypothetical protein